MANTQWADKLAIRELLERYMRYNDDGDIDSTIDLFEPDARYQVVGRVMQGHAELRAFWLEVGWTEGNVAWTAPGHLLIQPRSAHMMANPIIDIHGDRADCESDFLVVDRREDGRAKIMLVGRYRDRLRRSPDGQWRIAVRTGVSVARPGAAGTDSEWRALIGQDGIDRFEALDD
jgi:3-phenylpropionate/cinnamic acid dioxygenase small subunit